MLKKLNFSNWKAYVYIMPAILGIGVFTIYPIIQAAIWSLQKVNQLNPEKTKFVGLDNYKYLLSKKAFLTVLKNTGVYTLWTVIIILFIALVMAVMLNHKQNRLSKFAQAAAFTPHIISMVSISMVFTQMMNPNYGLFNTILSSLNLPTSRWLMSSDSAMGSVIFVACWKSIGYYCLIILGALQSVPVSLYEAAELDNSSFFNTLFHITIPMISPQLFFTLIVMTIGSFKVFDTVRLLTDGGPNNATSTIVYYIYKCVFWDWNVGRATAAGIILLLAVGLLTLIYFRLLNRRVYYQ